MEDTLLSHATGRPQAPRRRARRLASALVTGLVAAVGFPAAAGAADVSPSLGQVAPEASVSATQLPAAGWQPLGITVTAGVLGIENGVVQLDVPSGWAQPSASPASAGHTVASQGSLAVSGRTITVSHVTLAASGHLAITYGGGAAAPTEPSRAGVYVFSTSVARTADSAAAAVASSPTVRVVSPFPHGVCSTTQDPAGGAGSTISHHTAAIAVPNGVAEGNLWNTDRSAGTIRQCYGKRGLSTTISLRSIARHVGGPAGYPEVGYGHNLVDGAFCAPPPIPCNTAPFPLAVHDLRGRGYSVTTSYSLGKPHPGSLPRNLGYDFWLEQHPRFGSAPQRGDIEVLISLFHRGVISCGSSRPNFSQRITVGGKRILSRWRVCNLGGGSDGDLVGFLLERPTQARSRSVTLALKSFISKAIKQAAVVDHAKRSPFFVMGVELGAEFGGCDNKACTDTAARWTFGISTLTLQSRSLQIPIVFPSAG
jgi:hypothetical protein